MAINWSDTRYVEAGYEIDDTDRAGDEQADHDALPVATVHPHRRFATVDARLAEVVYWTWKNGIDTDESCEDAGGDALLGFPSIDDLSAFLAIVAAQDDVPGGVWDRATGSNLDPTAAGAWEYLFFPKLWGRRVEFPVAVLFPLADAPTLAERLRAAAGAMS